jgi:glycine betaine catabolism B
MLSYIDSYLNKITMYRLTLYYLTLLVGVGVIVSVFGLLPYKPIDILISTGIVLIVCVLSNYIFARLFHAVTNVESVFITAFILVLIVPLNYPTNLFFLLSASFLAMASKYVLTIEKQHIFNPAAVAVAGVSFLSNNAAIWWIGTPVLLPFVIVGGFLLVRKIRREVLVLTFLLSYLFIIAIASFFHSGSFASILTIWQLSIIHSALFFFAFVMLTEPITSPGTKSKQQLFAFVTAIFYATAQIRLLHISFTPEIALCLGNIFSYVISPKYRFLLHLKWKNEIAKDTVLFAFDRKKDFYFAPGQYLEWTLPHNNTDNRGNRRYFSLASSPTEEEILIEVKFYNPSSSYKSALAKLNSDQSIIATQLAGDFVLPRDLKTKLIFIAGGVGIAPFRSMIRYLIDNALHADIILFYTNKQAEDISFANLLDSARQYGVRTIYSLTDTSAVPTNWKGKTGHITIDMIKEEVSDYQKRTYYVSGPQPMVENVKKVLSDIHVSRKKIKTDFFPGYTE